MGNLESFGVQELSIKEQKAIEGGAIGCLIVLGIIAVGFCVGLGVAYLTRKE